MAEGPDGYEAGLPEIMARATILRETSDDPAVIELAKLFVSMAHWILELEGEIEALEIKLDERDDGIGSPG
jgi:hypothetical protein